jgi:hypothetical protein
MKIFLTSLAILMLASDVFAAQSSLIHQPRISARIMGMGGAYTAVADDYQTLYYNPAGLARREDSQFVAELHVGASPNILSFSSSPIAIQNTLQSYAGSHFSSRVGLGATWVRPVWGVGIEPLDLTIEADVHGTSGLTVGVQAYQDTVVQYGYSWNLNDKKTFNVGIAPKAVYRAYYENDLDMFQLAEKTDLFRASDAQEGLAIDGDIGVLYTLGIPEDGWFKWLKYAKPTFGFAVRNVVDGGFKSNFHWYHKDSSPNLSKLERRFDVGSKFELPEFWVFKPRFMIDARDMGTRYASFKKCFHVGTELLWKAFGWLNGGYRVGVSQGYVTGGLSAELGIFLLDVATYSEEVGTSEAPRENRRYIVQMSLDF